MLSDAELLNKFATNRDRAKTVWDIQHEKARINGGFYAGDRMYYQATVADKGGARRSVVFNKVKPFVDSVAGFFIQLRRKPDYQARIADSQRQSTLSDFLNSTSDYYRSSSNLDHIESTATKDMLIYGYSAVDTNITYERNPEGDICAENVEFDCIMADPMARAKNLLDATFVIREKYYFLDEALKMFDGSEETDFSYEDVNMSPAVPNPAGGPYTMVRYGTDINMDVVKVYYYQWYEIEPYYICYNPVKELLQAGDESGAEMLIDLLMTMVEQQKVDFEPTDLSSTNDLFKFDPTDDNIVMNKKVYSDFLSVIDIFNEQFDYAIKPESMKHKRRVYYTAILSDTKVFKKFISPDQNGFTIKFKTGDYDANNRIWIGMVDQLQEPNRYANKALTEILFVIASNAKGGVLYEEGSVINEIDFEQKYALTNTSLKVREGALSGGKIQPKATSTIPNGYENVYQIADQSISQVSGVNREFLGSSENRQVSAEFESQRIERVVSGLASYADSDMLYQKEHARLMITFLRILAENSPSRLIRITGENGESSYQEINPDLFNAEYDVEIGEIPTSVTQRQKTFEMLVQMAQLLGPQASQAIVPLAIDYMPLRQSEKIKFKQALAPAEPNPMAQQQSALQTEVIKAALETEKLDQLKKMNDLMLSDVKLNKEVASTQKIMLESEQKDLENQIMARNATSGNVTISI